MNEPGVPGVFDHPWHARLFSLTIALRDAGMIDWARWVDVFAGKLAIAGVHRDLDGGDDYYSVWLEATEQLLAEQNLTSPGEIGATLNALNMGIRRDQHPAISTDSGRTASG